MLRNPKFLFLDEVGRESCGASHCAPPCPTRCLSAKPTMRPHPAQATSALDTQSESLVQVGRREYFFMCRYIS
jgi:hypothetical protein